MDSADSTACLCLKKGIKGIKGVKGMKKHFTQKSLREGLCRAGLFFVDLK